MVEFEGVDWVKMCTESLGCPFAEREEKDKSKLTDKSKHTDGNKKSKKPTRSNAIKSELSPPNIKNQYTTSSSSNNPTILSDLGKDSLRCKLRFKNKLISRGKVIDFDVLREILNEGDGKAIKVFL